MTLVEADCVASVNTGSGYAPRAGFTGWLGETFTTSDIGYKFGYEYWATAKSAKAPKAVASIGYYNTWSGATPDVFEWDNDADGENEFIVEYQGDAFLIKKVGAAIAGIWFPVVSATGKIDTTREIFITAGAAGSEVEYAVNRAVNGDITFRNVDDQSVLTPANAGYAAVKTAFDSYFTALGFGYPDAKYMTRKNFSDKFGTIAYDSSEYAWAAGAVIVDPNAPKPPQTGDASTVAGFVMIALALVAAAAVTVKKVRA